MKYEINYDMAVELVHRYADKVYLKKKQAGLSPVKLEELFKLNTELRSLMNQLRSDGHNVDVIFRDIINKLNKKYRYQNIKVYTDGAARYNNDVDTDNKSAIAFAVYGDGKRIHEYYEYLGSTVQLPRLRNDKADYTPETISATNNTVEYLALVQALSYLLENDLHANHVQIFSDSKMIVTQVNLLSTTRAPHLIRLRDCAQELLEEFDNTTLTYISRESNGYVDGLVNRALNQAERQVVR